MFFDGIRYANVARNYAEGLGSFWKLNYGNSIYSLHYDQPPFVFFLQAQFFKILGDSIYTERLYVAVFAIIHLLLIKQLWKELAGSFFRYYWLPLMFWIIVPLCSWTFKNNLLEATMGAFDLAAVIIILRGCRLHKTYYLLAGGTLVLLASLCKGFQGLFPVTVPLFYWFIYREGSFRQMFLQTCMVVSVIVAAYVYFYMTPEIRQSIGHYFTRRLEATFNHVHDTKKSHFYLLFKLILELLPPVIITFVLWFFGRKKKPGAVDTKAISLMILTGISASFPLMITLEQRAFYLTTSLPYYIIALSLIAAPYLSNHVSDLGKKKYRKINTLLVSIILITLIIIGFNAHKPKRDFDLLHDLYILKKQLPVGTVVSIPEPLSENWAYLAYFMRYGKITLDHYQANRFYLTESGNEPPTDTCYKQIDLGLKKFNVFECSLK